MPAMSDPTAPAVHDDRESPENLRRAYRALALLFVIFVTTSPIGTC